MKAQTRAWLELLRLPNLFTVPGDVIVGWCLAGQRGVLPWWGVLGSLCLYAAGLLMNDVADARVDARERPTRPIPSKRISRGRATTVALVLTLLGVVLAGTGWPVALILLALIGFYDLGGKSIPWVGVVTMGACRGANLLLGAAASWPTGAHPYGTLLWMAVGFFICYIVAVSVVAKNEARPRATIGPWLRFTPLLLTLALIPLFYWAGRAPLWPVLLGTVAILPPLVARNTIPTLVAALIRHLIPLQLLWCLVVLPEEALAIPLFLISCWLGAKIASRHFAGS